jgi:hypothetical protein
MTDQELIAKFYESIKELTYPENSLGWYIEKFPEPYRSQAFENINDQWDDPKQILYAVKPPQLSITTFLTHHEYSFTWSESQQGHSYWKQFFRTIENTILNPR